jgi:hypothetical protein|tara:strand:+ start:124 stop:315 length:192 start_codon:yes stop_codon:yes gene_type:complete
MSGRVDTETKLWLKNCQHWEKKMAKRLIEGKKKSKGKKYSHRPVRSQNVYFDTQENKWFANKK